MNKNSAQNLTTKKDISKKLSKQDKKELIKTSMKVCMGVSVVSGFMSGRLSRKVHIISGIAFVGLAVYHNALYEK